MIFVKILGGLGNQMFQVAYAIKLAKERGDDDIVLDVSVFDSYKVRSFSINNLGLPNNITISEKTITSNFPLTAYQFIYRCYQKVAKSTGFTNRFGEVPFRLLSKFGFYFNFDNFYYDIPASSSKNIHLYGYFQSEKYFIDIESEIRNFFKVNVKPTKEERHYLDKIRNSHNSLALSMRLGSDYLALKDFNVCDKEYYIKAINQAKCEIEKPDIFVFSDDISAAKNILSQYDNLTFVQGFSDYESLRLMSSCKHFIISNSSFSWWGAYLGEFEDKKVYAPKKWYSYMTEEVGIYTEKMVRL